MNLNLKYCLMNAVTPPSLIFTSSASADYWTRDVATTPVFESSVGATRIVSGLAAPSGKVLVNGSYPIINGQAVADYLARLNSDGTIDNTFHGPAGSTALAVYPDGRVLVATNRSDGINGAMFQRLLANGSIDSGFTPVAVEINYLKAVILGDGGIILYGDFGTVGGMSRPYLAALSPNGVVDANFHSPFSIGSSVIPLSVAPAVDGLHILIGGNYLSLGTGRTQIARLNRDGSVDSGFGVAAIAGIVDGVAQVYPGINGSVLFADSHGNLFDVSSTGAAISFTPTLIGSDFQFGPRQGDGKIFYISSGYVGSSTTRFLRRMNSDGTDDAGFHAIATPYASTYEIAMPSVASDGTLFVGAATAERDQARQYMTRVLANGDIDSGFNPRFGGYGQISAELRLTDGKSVVAGQIDHVNGIALAAVAGSSVVRLNPDGTLDPSFHVSLPANSSVDSLYRQAGGKIILRGGFPTGSSDGLLPVLTRINADGTTDASFHLFTDQLAGFAVDDAGFIYGTKDSARLLRYTPDGLPDPTFQTNIAGNFTVPLIGGAVLVIDARDVLHAPTLTRLFHTGAIDPAFAASPLSDALVAAVPLPDGNALVCTSSSSPNNQNRYVLSRMLPSGVVDYTYVTQPMSGYSSTAPSEAAQLQIAGVLFDLLRSAAPVAGTVLAADFTQSGERANLTCDTMGKLSVAVSYSGGISYLKYQRTSLVSPSVDAAPRIAFGVLSPTVRVVAPISGADRDVIATGLAPFEYQWLKDGVPISGDTNSFITIGRGQILSPGNYSVKVTNSYGSAVRSIFTLTEDSLIARSVVVVQPADQQVPPGSTVSFTVLTAAENPPTYQWTFNGNPIPGAITTSLVLQNVKLADTGEYALQISNSAQVGGFPFSWVETTRPAQLNVRLELSPAFVAQPSSVTVAAGFGAIFTASSLGQPAPTFQWQKNGVNISGATAASLALANLSASDAGSYRVVATNSAGAATSDTAVLTVIAPVPPAPGAGPATADFDHDGQSDLVWQNTLTGERSFWLMNGSILKQGVSLGTFAPDWNVAAMGDFNHDGQPDVVWQNTITGERSIWLMNGTSLSAGVDLGTYSIDWMIVAVGDFNGDGQTDILLQNTITGERSVWLMSGTTKTSEVSLGIVLTAWSIAGVGDINGDGKLDIIWQNAATGERSVWLMNGTTMVSNVSLGLVAKRFQIVATGDYNHDGKTDFVWTDTETGDRSIWMMNGLARVSTVPLATVSLDWSVGRPIFITAQNARADFDADGHTDIIWQNSATGERKVWLMNGTTKSLEAGLGTVAAGWVINGTGDFNRDEKPDLVWTNTATGERSVWLMDGTTMLSSVSLGNVPANWVISAIGDFNYDGKPDLVWTNAATGERSLWLMNGTVFNTGVALGTIPIEWKIATTADLNGDGKVDIVWQNKSTGECSVWLMNGGTFTAGVALDTLPAQWSIVGSGDFNGDGKADLLLENTVTGEKVVRLMNRTNYLSTMSLGIFGTLWSIKN